MKGAFFVMPLQGANDFNNLTQGVDLGYLV
jgi:hypothetical protein